MKNSVVSTSAIRFTRDCPHDPGYPAYDNLLKENSHITIYNMNVILVNYAKNKLQFHDESFPLFNALCFCE